MTIPKINLLKFYYTPPRSSYLGGVIGIGIGYAYIVSAFAKWPPLVSWEGVVRRIVLYDVRYYFWSIFGLIPANKAASMRSNRSV
jgi:putative ABC transport system permease protein